MDDADRVEDYGRHDFTSKVVAAMFVVQLPRSCIQFMFLTLQTFDSYGVIVFSKNYNLGTPNNEYRTLNVQ